MKIIFWIAALDINKICSGAHLMRPFSTENNARDSNSILSSLAIFVSLCQPTNLRSENPFYQRFQHPWCWRKVTKHWVTSNVSWVQRKCIIQRYYLSGTFNDRVMDIFAENRRIDVEEFKKNAECFLNIIRSNKIDLNWGEGGESRYVTITRLMVRFSVNSIIKNVQLFRKYSKLHHNQSKIYFHITQCRISLK